MVLSSIPPEADGGSSGMWWEEAGLFWSECMLCIKDRKEETTVSVYPLTGPLVSISFNMQDLFPAPL